LAPHPDPMALRLALVVICALASVGGVGPSEDPPKPKVVIPAEVSVEAGSARAWALLICSVPSERDKFRHDILSGAVMHAGNVQALRTLLEVKFKAKNAAEAVKLLDKVTTGEGLHGPLNKLFRDFEQTKLTEEQLQYLEDREQRELMLVLLKHCKRALQVKEGMLAFESVHYAMLCRYLYGAGYISEADVWKRLDPVAKKLQKSYASFEAVGEIYAIGVELTDQSAAEKTWAAWNKLKDDEKSVWKSAPWNLRLGSLAKPEIVAPKK
jgi:hypothetical protein